jgi:4-hydroxy-tetrahydrodipicolinate synthase
MLITPFRGDFSIDEAGLRSNVQFLLGNGITGGIVVGGSLGECYAMSIDERKALFGIVVDAVGKRVPVVCCVNDTATFLSVDLARHAEAVGADGVMVLPPNYMTPNERQILLHIGSVAEAISIGVMVYNNKWFSGVDLSVNLLSRLAEHENVVAVKDCTPDFFRFREGVDRLGTRLTVLSCYGEYWEPYASLAGSKGFISVIANWAPEVVLELAKAGAKHDLERGLRAFQRLVPYIKVEMSVAAEDGDGETTALFKAAMKLCGLAGGPVRPPLYPLPDKFIAPLRHALQHMGALEAAADR